MRLKDSLRHEHRRLVWHERIAVISETIGLLVTLYLVLGLPFPPHGPEMWSFITLVAVFSCGSGLLFTILRRSPWSLIFGLVLGLYCLGFLLLRGRHLLIGLAPIVTGALDGNAVAGVYSSLLVTLLLLGHGIASALVVGRHYAPRAVAA